MIITNYIFMANKILREIVLGGLAGAVLVLGSYFGLKSDFGKEALNSTMKYMNSQIENTLMEEGDPYVSLTVKPGDSIHELTFACYGRPRGETTKVEALDAVLKLNGLENSVIHPNQELYVPFNEKTAGSLDYCLERAEKNDNGKPQIFRLHVDEGRHYLLPENVYSQIEDLVQK